MLLPWRIILFLLLFLPDDRAQAIGWHSSTTMLCSMLQHNMMVEHNMVVGGCASVESTGEIIPIFPWPFNSSQFWSRVVSSMGVFKECSVTMINNFRVLAENGRAVETKRIFGAFSKDVIARSAFSITIDAHNDRDNEFVMYAKRVLNFDLGWKFICFHEPRPRSSGCQKNMPVLQRAFGIPGVSEVETNQGIEIKQEPPETTKKKRRTPGDKRNANS